MRPLRPIPEDFAQYATAEGILKLRKRYRTTAAVIIRWRAILGVGSSKPGRRKQGLKVINRRLSARRRRMQAAERIEDLDDFGQDELEQCVGYKRAVGDW